MLSYRDFKDILLSFSYKKNQIFLVSFPKTGRTWLSYMLREIESKKNIDLNYIISHDFSEIIIESGFRQDSNIIFKNTNRYFYRRAKVIFLVRDPRDVIVSHFHQVTKRAKNPLQFSSISSFVRNKSLGFNRIIHFYNLWCKQKHIPKSFYLIKYEDLVNNGENELKKLLSFFNVNVSSNLIDQVYSESNAKKMRQKELQNKLSDFNNFGKQINQLKVRKAKVGNYKDELDLSDINYCNELMKNLNTYFKYKI